MNREDFRKRFPLIIKMPDGTYQFETGEPVTEKRMKEILDDCKTFLDSLPKP